MFTIYHPSPIVILKKLNFIGFEGGGGFARGEAPDTGFLKVPLHTLREDYYCIYIYYP